MGATMCLWPSNITHYKVSMCVREGGGVYVNINSFMLDYLNRTITYGITPPLCNLNERQSSARPGISMVIVLYMTFQLSRDSKLFRSNKWTLPSLLLSPPPTRVPHYKLQYHFKEGLQHFSCYLLNDLSIKAYCLTNWLKQKLLKPVKYDRSCRDIGTCFKHFLSLFVTSTLRATQEWWQETRNHVLTYTCAVTLITFFRFFI